MKTSSFTSRLRSIGAQRRLPGMLLAMGAIWAAAHVDGASSAAPSHLGQRASGAHAAQPYAIVPLSDDVLAFGVDINSREQVAFTELFEQPDPGVYRARFYDAGTTYTLGTFGGNNAYTLALNRSGQVTGAADTGPASEPFDATHAYRWSRQTGLVDLSIGPLRASTGADINDRGEVAGSAIFDPAIDVSHAARWSARNQVQDLGTLAGGSSGATAISEAGMVVGWSQAPQAPALRVPFRWRPATGMQGLGTFASENAAASDVNGTGVLVGTAPLRQAGPERAFLWSPREGLLDLGASSGTSSGATRINEHGMVTGFISNFPEFGIGFVWTRESGPIELGRLNINRSTADDLNNRGQVVGSIDGRAFIWNRNNGIVDLNERVRAVPQGLVLRRALAINDDGAIVALSNSGLVLLTRKAQANLRPLAGPVIMTGSARAGATLSFSVSFTDVDVGDTHTASWDWGEGAVQPALVNERNGSGNVSGQHVYQAEGEYRVRLTLTDSSGRSTTVRLDLIVVDQDPCVASGQGWFMSPPGAVRLAPASQGVAAYAFAAPTHHGHGKPALSFTGPGLRFRADTFKAETMRGERVRYSGTGSVNGHGGYRFLLSALKNAVPGDDQHRFMIRIWRPGPDRGAAAVVYDNLSDGQAGQQRRTAH